MTVVSDVEGYDRYAAAALRLMHAFHLRFKEGLMFRPHQDALIAQQALARWMLCLPPQL